MNHNAEPEAVDLLMEVEALGKLVGYTSENNYERVCLYLLSCSNYAADPEEMMNALKTAYEIYLKHHKYPQALRVAQKINNPDLIKTVMEECKDLTT